MCFRLCLTNSYQGLQALQADKHLPMSALSQVRNFVARWCDNQERPNELQTVSTRDGSLKTSKKRRKQRDTEPYAECRMKHNKDLVHVVHRVGFTVSALRAANASFY